MQFDSYNPLTFGSNFSNSSVQIYQTLQAPYIPLEDQPGYLPQYLTNKISTSPVALNAPANSPGTTTGDTYSATLNYDGYTLTLNLFDVTAGGSCPGSNCFTHTWTGVYIPEITGATSAYVGLVAGTSGAGGGSPHPLEIKSFTYKVNTPTGTPAYTAWNANSTYNNGTVSAASPVYSLAPGSYAGSQSVSMSTSTGPHNYICYVLSSTTPALYPHPDNNGGCSSGSLYTGPVSISSTATLYAMAGSNNAAFPLGSVEPPGLGPPSTLVAATYTIGTGSVAAAPTFSPAGGAFTSPQSVSINDGTPGVVICYNTTGSPATNGSTGCSAGTVYVSPIAVSASETIYAVAGGTGYTDSSIASAPYIIKAPPTSPVATTTTLVAPANHLINGQQASLTATVAAASGAVPTGSVSFYTGTQLLGSAALGSGQATLTAPVSTQPGTYQVTAVYNGSTLDNKSTSAPLTFTVVATTTNALTSNATQVVEGSSVVLTAAVTPTFGSAAPSGAVAFFIGSTALGTQRLSAGSATDSAQINLPAGQYQLTAVYEGDSNDESSTSNAVTLTVTAPATPQISTSTALTVSPVAPTAGQSMRLTSVVAAASGSTPTGVVNFYLGRTQIGSAPLSSGVAKLSLNAPSSSGSYLITAMYAGTTQDSASSSAPVTITIAPSVEATTTSLVSSTQQLIQGQSFALSASVASNGSGNVTGLVNFFLGQTQIGSVGLSKGQASWTGPASFTPGTYQLTAQYTGDSQDSASTSNPLTLVVTAPSIPQSSTNTSLAITPTAPAPGQSIRLSSIVTAASGSTPTGVVNFYLGQTQVGSASLISGAANVSINAPASSGSYPVTAVYAGSSQDSASTSAPVTITIAPSVVSTSINLVASAQQIVQGQSLALSATVVSSNSSAPTGTVNFYLGQTQVGSSVLANGQAGWAGPATFTPGIYQVTAVYSGDSIDSGSTSTALPLTILAAATVPSAYNTTTSLAFSPQQVASGQTVSISVQVAEQGGTSMPSGSVAVYLGQTEVGTSLLSNGSASLSMEAPAPGTYTLTAVYSGEGQDLGSQSPAIVFVVNVPVANAPVAPTQPGNPTFTLGLSNSSISLADGKEASLQVSLSAVQGYQGAVQLSCSGLPAGFSCNFSPSTVALQSATADSMLSISSNTAKASNSAVVADLTYAMMLPWNIFGILGMASGSLRLKLRFGTLLVMLLAASAALATLTGCGLNVRSITQPYQVSVTAVGANQQSQTQTFTLNVTGPAATF